MQNALLLALAVLDLAGRALGLPVRCSSQLLVRGCNFARDVAGVVVDMQPMRPSIRLTDRKKARDPRRKLLRDKRLHEIIARAGI